MSTPQETPRRTEVRRLVTGLRDDGTHGVVADERVVARTARAFAGLENALLYAADAVPPVPNDGVQPSGHPFFPAAGGVRVFVLTIEPAHAVADPGPITEADLGEAEAVFPGLLAYHSGENPAMHRTCTVDVGIVLEGSVEVELDDGETHVLAAGDTIVQNGTRHAWHNRGEGTARLAFVVLGATPA